MLKRNIFEMGTTTTKYFFSHELSSVKQQLLKILTRIN